MIGGNSEVLLKQVRRLFNLGSVGTMTDAQLLDWFVSRRDDAAEAAFEELVIRHGRMVLNVCQRVVRDAHSAEDAFQAVFLILAARAGSIAHRDSVASWLFGVAHRVSSRARARRAKQRLLERKIAERTSEAYLPADGNLDWEILYAELDRLPERLRAPIVLCYLEGSSYAESARRLGVTEGVLRGRLARAKARLKERLSSRGLALPAGLLAATAVEPGRTHAAVTASLVQSTVRIALGLVTEKIPTLLARGFLTSMLLNRLKAVTVVLLIGACGGFGIWHGMAAAFQDKRRDTTKPAATKTATAEATSKKPPPTPKPAYQPKGVVRVEGSGEPVQGVPIPVVLQNSIQEAKLRVLVVESYPRWEYRYLRNALSRDPGVELSCLLFHPGLSKTGGSSKATSSAVSGRSWTSYPSSTSCFLGDVGVEDGQLTVEQCRLLKGLVEHQASGLVFIPGWQGRELSLLDTELGDLCPVVLDPAQPGGWGSRVANHFELTESGRRSLLTKLADTPDDNADVWVGLPGFRWYAAALRAQGRQRCSLHAQGRFQRIWTSAAPGHADGTAARARFSSWAPTAHAWQQPGVEDKYHYRFWGPGGTYWMAYQRNMAKGRDDAALLRTRPAPAPSNRYAACQPEGTGRRATVWDNAAELTNPSGCCPW